MKSLSVNVLDKSDEEFADTLIELGLKRNVAKILTYLKNVKEITSRDLEMSSDLRQPEVSIAMRELEELAWIGEREEKKPGKGRPYKIYQLKTSIEAIIEYLETQKKKKSQAMMASIKRLKELSK